MIQVLLAEDHNIVRNGIKMLLGSDKEIHVAGEATNGREALEFISNNEGIDVILADINMPELDGISLIKEAHNLNPNIRVVILSMHDNDKYVSQAFQEGASGYLLKSVSADEMIFSLKHVKAGGKYLCSELSIKMLEKLSQKSVNSVAENVSNIEFSMREIEVLHLIADGLTNSEMSEKLFLSKRTIEGHRQSLIEKTGSKNTAALIRYAVLNGIIN
ncbi:DNA-binding response regulator [Pedobacter quisquiliarum]|jgi:DNA-binding NarL/FixJ family response regulator|uniref:DNA-binding response regulator n=1 Tax=Pedobacter quisquiliarum TaxID=1834438 RepID=A0A916TZK9_9SPHI|nr:response regulator transcription factor [Pedobacter quisquiliarum]GGC53636.1 DNA-binding response regulator [Pedobacter quisquiliarum]